MLKIITLLLFVESIAQANSVFIDFETLLDGDSVTNQFPNLNFQNSVVLSAGISLNEFEFPPRSGANVVSEDGGPISISFATPIQSFSGYFTYAEPLILNAFDSSNTLVASISSVFSNNEALSGDSGRSPNEFLEVSFGDGIYRVTITGDSSGGSFAMDDVTATSNVADPPSIYLTPLGLALLVSRRITRNHE